jgi:hypothetical protein
MRRRAVVLFLQALPVLSLVGCSGEKVNRPDPVLVTGVVTHNGSPVEGANVIFQPAGHNFAATGRTDATGTFKLTAFEPDDGAVPGEYKVAVTKSEVTVTGGGGSDDSPTTTKEKLLLPIKYARADGSGLVASVKSGAENKFEFKLEGDASKNPAGGLAPPRPTIRTGE